MEHLALDGRAGMMLLRSHLSLGARLCGRHAAPRVEAPSELFQESWRCQEIGLLILMMATRERGLVMN